MPTIPIKWLTDSNANKRYPVTHTKAVFNDDGDDLDTILSGLGGSLAELSDTTITSPSNGQVLTYDGTSSKWINAASSGGSGIQTLTSPIRIWDLNPGLYFIPNPCTVYYRGSTDTTAYAWSGGGILNIWWQTENTSKNWMIWSNQWNSAYSSKPSKVYWGYTTSSTGVNYSDTVVLAANSTKDNSIGVFMGAAASGTASDLNVLLKSSCLTNGIVTATITTSTTNIPSNLTISQNTNCLIVTENSEAYKSYNPRIGFLIRQDLYIPSLNKHYYKNVQYDGSVLTPDTSIPNCDSNGWVEVMETYPSLTGNAGKVLAVNSGATGVEWVNSSGGTADYDFTHTSNTTVSTATTTITFAANQRCSQMITISSDLGISVVCNNLSDNYLWIKNTGSSEVDITINSFSLNGNTVSNVYMPSDGISVPAGNICEIGIMANADGAFISSRNDLAL